jgi:hypothetical protein
MIIFIVKRGTSKYSRALAAILRSGHTRILLNSPSATGMVRYAAMVLWYPIKLGAILLFEVGPLTSLCCSTVTLQDFGGMICCILAEENC